MEVHNMGDDTLEDSVSLCIVHGDLILVWMILMLVVFSFRMCHVDIRYISAFTSEYTYFIFLVV